MIGDVVGSAGCEKLRKHLPELKRKYQIDLTVVNGENSADGNGILPVSADHIFQSGADVITGGNHSFRRREIYDRYEKDEFLLRPANYPDSAPGSGLCIVDKGRFQAGVISLMGEVYLQSTRCPFTLADDLIKKAKDMGCKVILVDIHAEATGEKKALGYYLDGKVTAVVGTHTHVQTADARLLPRSTAYITDVGMCGPFESVLGVKPELSIALMKDKLPVRFETASGDCQMDGVVIRVNPKNGLAEDIFAFSI
jgi:metallophosphoesterase (TIGR00282 family)